MLDALRLKESELAASVVIIERQQKELEASVEMVIMTACSRVLFAALSSLVVRDRCPRAGCRERSGHPRIGGELCCFVAAESEIARAVQDVL